MIIYLWRFYFIRRKYKYRQKSICELNLMYIWDLNIQTNLKENIKHIIS